MTTISAFAERLTALRENKGKKRQDVADDIQISRASLEYYEKGKRKPDIEVLLKLADYYNVTCDYLLKGVKTENVSINEVTGLSDEAIDELQKGKNSVFYTTLLNFLINNRVLLKALNSYLLSSIYNDYRKSDYMYLPLKDKAVYIHNPEIAQKVAYSNLLEVLPMQKEKMTEQIKDNQELKEKLLFELAKRSVDMKQCKIREMEIYGLDYYQATPEELEEYYNSEQFEQDQLQACYDEIKKYEEYQKANEEIFERNGFILWFMNELSKQKGGDDNANNPKT